jgi:hypothetical protein
MTPVETLHSTILDATSTRWNDADVVRVVCNTLSLDVDAAARIVRLTQIGWCRVYLRDLCRMPVKFSDEYVSFDADGQIESRGRLSAESWYQSALKVDRRYVTHPAFKSFAIASAEFMAVGELLQRGSKPSNILTSPAFFLPSNPSEHCRAAAEVIMQQETLDHSERVKQTPREAPHTKANRPWWKFWCL